MGEKRVSNSELRLSRLEEHRIVERRPHDQDGRRHTYRLTEKGIALAPVLLEMILWAARHEATAAPAREVTMIGSSPAEAPGETWGVGEVVSGRQAS